MYQRLFDASKIAVKKYASNATKSVFSTTRLPLACQIYQNEDVLEITSNLHFKKSQKMFYTNWHHCILALCGLNMGWTFLLKSDRRVLRN